MSSQRSTNSKPSKPPNQSQSQSQSPNPSQSTAIRSSTSSLPTHLAMVELKQKILTSLSKLSDRDTHQIAMEDLEKTIQCLPPDAVSMLLNCLYDSSASPDPKPAVKKESLRLIAVACAAHADAAGPHLPKILAHIVRRLKDADSGVRDACRDAVGALSAQYLVGEGGAVAALFVRPLFEAMAEQNKGLQAGAAMCVARAVECAADPPVSVFQKLCPRICKLLNSPNFLAKSALLPVISSLAQVGAISSQSLENLLHSIHDCLGSSDWATRKAAADTLIALALHSRNLIAEITSPTTAVLEASRFDKIKPVRESMTEALQLWKNIAGKGNKSPDDRKSLSNENRQPNDASDKDESKNPKQGEKKELSARDSPNSLQALDSENKTTGTMIPEKAVVILKKKMPTLTDKELNPEFFHKLETRGSGDFPVEVAVPRRYLNSSNSNNEEDLEKSNSDPKRLSRGGNTQSDDPQGIFGGKYRNLGRDKWPEERTNGKDSRIRAIDGDDRSDLNQRESSSNRAGFSKTDAQSEGSFVNNKGNWLAIQRQLLQLERQQAHLMNMLQDFMGGSHDSMITLENRVRGLERVVEDMARDLSLSSGRRGPSFGMGFDGSSNRSLGKYNNGFPDYSGGNAKFGRGSDGRAIPFGERFAQAEISAGSRGRGSHWRSDGPEAWDFPTYGSRNGQMGSRRDKGPARLGEGPSARSVWQASKDEATLEAIRVAGEDTARVATAIPEMTAEAMRDEDGGEQERDPVWTSWTNAMDALHASDMDAAYAEVLSTGDDMLLVKLMDRTGPVIDQLSNEVANETLHAIVQFLAEQNLFDICLSWVQQLAEIVVEHGQEILGIPIEVKREILLNLHEASLSMDPPEDWEGAMPDQIVMQLATSWDIDLQHNDK